MVNEYAPKLFLRQAENELLRQYFARCKEHEQLRWDVLEETAIDPIYDAWQALPEPAREEIERDFRKISDLASAEGTRTLIEEGDFHDIDLKVELEAHDGFVNKAFYVFLDHQDVFDVAHLLNRADHLSPRYWRKRKDMPKKEPDLSQEAIDELTTAISAYYLEREGRERHCHVDKYLRGNRYHYFFVYPQDYADTFVGFNEAGRFERRTQNPAFEVIFVYDPVDGSLDLYARGDKKIKQHLQHLFGRTILHEELSDEERNPAAYELNALKQRDFAFPTDPADRIVEVRVRELRLSMIGSSHRRITYDVGPEGRKEEIYEVIDRALNKEVLPLSVLNVTSAVIQIRFDNASGKGRSVKTVSFRVSFPDSCNLRDEPEHLIAKGYLKKWGIERA
jgi:hypothetical protein